MKDKRTYTNLKEYGEDMSHENESKITNEVKEDRGPNDLSLMVELHQKEIWEWKQKESEYIQTKNLLDGSKRIIAEMGKKIIEQTRIIKQLEQEIERLVAENKK
jgi:4-diphosphocytidyl-2C-methyl-D-erythritol kinase